MPPRPPFPLPLAPCLPRALPAMALAALALPAMALLAPLTARADALLVLSKKEQALAIVDPATLRVQARVPAGPDPHEVIASDDGKMAWISNYGFGAYHTLTPVDLVKRKALPPIDLGALRGPHGLRFSGGKVWFTAEGAKALGRFDPATQKIDLILGTGEDRTHMLFVFPGEERLASSNVSSGTVTFFDLAGRKMPAPPPGASGGPPPGPPPGAPKRDWTETRVTVGEGSEGFDVTPDRRELWVAAARSGDIDILDMDNEKIIEAIPGAARGANRLKITADGKHALVSVVNGAELLVFDVPARKLERRIPLGHGASGILLEPGGKRAFVACSPDDKVAAIELADWKIEGWIEPGGGPDGMAWASAGK